MWPSHCSFSCFLFRSKLFSSCCLVVKLLSSSQVVVICAGVILYINMKDFLKYQTLSVSQKLIQDGYYVSFLTSRCFRSRRRRSSDMVFSPNMVHILPGYPKRSPEDPKIAMIALYLRLPPDVSQGTVLSKYILTTVIKSNMPSIGRSMNGSIVSVYPLSSPAGEFQTNDNKSEANRTGATLGGIVGGCLFLVVIVVLLMVYVKNGR